MTNAMDYYKVLRVAKGASDDEIKKSYRNLAKQYHPDKNKEKDAEEKFKEISAAYDTLKDPEKKKLYDLQRETDEFRARNEQRAKERASQQGSGTSNSNGGFRFSTFGNFRDSEPTFSFSTKGGKSKSYSFTDNGTNFTFKTTFNTFDDDSAKDTPRKSKGKENQGGTKTKGKKKDAPKSSYSRRKFEFTRPDWDDSFSEGLGSSRRESPFSFSFDTRDAPSGDPFRDFDSIFEDFFRDPFFKTSESFPNVSVFTTLGNGRRDRQRHRNRNHSTGRDSGLGEDDGTFGSYTPTFGSDKASPRQRAKKQAKTKEEGMYDWKTPPWGQQHGSDEDSDYDNYDIGANGEIRLQCSYCGRKFNSENLARHENVCKKLNHSKSKARSRRTKPVFTVGSDESDSDHDTSSASANRTSGSHAGKGKNWRQQHEELINNIRNARKATKAQREGKPMPPPPPPTENPDYVMCEHCGRSFNVSAANRHIPVCKQRTEDRGSPVSYHGKPTATDYGSKSYHRKQYDRTVPKPTPSYQSTPRTRVGGRAYMDQPFSYTGSGLHAAPSRDRPSPRPTTQHTTRGPTLSGVKGKNVHFSSPNIRVLFSHSPSSNHYAPSFRVSSSASSVPSYTKKQFGTPNLGKPTRSAPTAGRGTSPASHHYTAAAAPGKGAFPTSHTYVHRPVYRTTLHRPTSAPGSLNNLSRSSYAGTPRTYTSRIFIDTKTPRYNHF